jgi:hypothetical protein
MTGLGPVIHAFSVSGGKTWMPGPSPGKTLSKVIYATPFHCPLPHLKPAFKRSSAAEPGHSSVSPSSFSGFSTVARWW